MKAKQGNERFSLSRWSRRKLEAAAKPSEPAPTVSAPASAAPATGVPATGAPAAAAPVASAAAPELPPVESLSFDSDFSVFLRPGVDAEVRQAALKKLLRDPRFNVMDGLDTYIDDYTKSDPIEPDVLADLLKRGFGGGTEAEPAPAALTNPPSEPSATGAQPAEPANASSATPATDAQPAALVGAAAETSALASSPSEESAAPAPSAKEEREDARPGRARRDVSQSRSEGKSTAGR